MYDISLNFCVAEQVPDPLPSKRPAINNLLISSGMMYSLNPFYYEMFKYIHSL